MRGPWLTCALVAAASLSAPRSFAGQPFVDAPLTLEPGHFAGDVGVGFGTTVSGIPSPVRGGLPFNVTLVGPARTEVGRAIELQATVGVPVLGELGLRAGAGLDELGIPSGADHYGRLFDPILTDSGSSDVASAEFHWRGTLVSLPTFELGFEGRFVVPVFTEWAAAGGIPIRIHIPGLLRIDTGAWLPAIIACQQCGPSNDGYISFDVPVQAFFEIGDAFLGPFTGVRVDYIATSYESVDIPVGFGGGYTFGGIIDVKAQVRTERLNSPSWASQALGGGFGAGVRVP